MEKEIKEQTEQMIFKNFVFGVPEKLVEDDKTIYKFLLTNEEVDGDGDVIDFSTLNVERFKANPQMYLNHNRSQLPIGQWQDIAITPRGLEASAKFHNLPNIDFTNVSYIVELYVSGGWLKTASIGFYYGERQIIQAKDGKATLPNGRTIKTGTFKQISLLKNVSIIEASIVDIPANPAATMLSLQKFLDNFELKTTNEIEEKAGRELSNANISKIKSAVEKLSNISKELKNVAALLNDMTTATVEEKPEEEAKEETIELLTKQELTNIIDSIADTMPLPISVLKEILTN